MTRIKIMPPQQEMQEVRYMDKGTVEERALCVVNALRCGWMLVQSQSYYGAYLLDPEDPDRICVILRPVIEHLIACNIIELHAAE